MATNEKINDLVKRMNKKMGEGSVFSGGSRPLDIPRISTGISSLDRLVGGGWPQPGIVEIFGTPGSGKTTLCLHTIAAAQKEGKTCIFIDMENAVHLGYAAACGVDTDNLVLAQPETAEQAMNLIFDCVRSDEFAVIVLDSIATLVPRAELEGESGDSHMGLAARIIRQGLRKVSSALKSRGTTVILTNQITSKITSYGNPETTTGGSGPEYFSKVRVKVRKTKSDRDGFNATKVDVVKNKTAPWGTETLTFYIDEYGVDSIGDFVDSAITSGFFIARGAWIDVPTLEKPVQGKGNLITLLRDDPDFLEKMLEMYENGVIEEVKT